MCILTSVGIKNGKETKAILCSLISLPLIDHFQYIIFFDNLRHDIPGGHFSVFIFANPDFEGGGCLRRVERLLDQVL